MMNPIFEETTANLQSILDMWDVKYDKEDEKYVATTTSEAVIDPEKIEWIMHLDLVIYSIQTFGDTVTVRFICRKGGVFS